MTELEGYRRVLPVAPDGVRYAQRLDGMWVIIDPQWMEWNLRAVLTNRLRDNP